MRLRVDGADAPQFEEADGDSDEEYVPEEILKQRIRKGQEQPEYLVKWEGYAASESTWELHENIASSETVIKSWVSKLKSQLKRKRKQPDQRASAPNSKPCPSANAAGQDPSQDPSHKRARGKRVVTAPLNRDM